MSTLSELIPSGGTQNNIEFVAQGTLANGQTVALRSDGKVEAVAQTSVSGSMGTAVQFEAAGVRDLAAAYSVEDNKYLVIYTDQGDSNKLKAVVGTPSGTNTISFGTPVAVSANANQYQASKGCSYDATAKKIVVSFSDAGNSNYLTTLVATISGTSVSFGAATILNSATSNYVHSFYHAGAGKTCVVSSLASSGLLRTCTVGSTAITSSTAANFSSSQTEYTAGCYESKNALGVIYFRRTSTGYPMVRGFTLSGETATFGTEDTLVSINSYGACLAYDAKNDYVCVIINYTTNTQNSIGARLSSNGSVASKTSVTQVAAANSFNSSANGIVYDAGGESVYACFYSGNQAVMNIMSFGSNAYTIGSSITVTSSSSYPAALAQSSANFNIGVFYRDGNNSNYGYGSDYVVARLSTNASSFIGITNAAISSGATGEVAVKGGLSTGGNVLPFAPTGGTPVTVLAGAQYWRAITYDTNSNKIVIAMRDDNASNAGVAFVGTVSGTSISFGSKVTFSAGANAYYATCFDSSNNKVVIVYRDNNNSNYGTAIVGTVSGTSISFGSPAVFESGAIASVTCAFDSSNNKVVIAYEDDQGNHYGKAVVGTVSGTSISFGSAVTFFASYSYDFQAVFDSNANKVVIAFIDYDTGDYSRDGKAIVGTVSGTSISFGSAVLFKLDIDYPSIAFDSSNNKVVIAYGATAATPDTGNAIVGTVSGTSISFGAETIFQSNDVTYKSCVFDSSKSQIVISYQHNDNANKGTVITGTVSGTSISFGSSYIFDAGSTKYIASVFDPDANKTITSYGETTDGGKAVVIDVTNDLTPNTAYFVQDDGTLATTSSTTKAGKAISTTALNLVDPT